MKGIQQLFFFAQVIFCCMPSKIPTESLMQPFMLLNIMDTSVIIWVYFSTALATTDCFSLLILSSWLLHLFLFLLLLSVTCSLLTIGTELFLGPSHFCTSCGRHDCFLFHSTYTRICVQQTTWKIRILF